MKDFLSLIKAIACMIFCSLCIFLNMIKLFQIIYIGYIEYIVNNTNEYIKIEYMISGVFYVLLSFILGCYLVKLISKEM